MRRAHLWSLVALATLLASCSGGGSTPSAGGNSRSPATVRDGPSSYKIGQAYSINGRTYVPEERFNYLETGRASWYGPGFDGRPTANGEIFDTQALTAAHRTLQLPSIVRVTNIGNGVSAIIRVNDRGPYHGDRVLDVSEAAADALGFKVLGVALVQVEVLEEPSREVARLAQAGAPIAELDRVRAAASENVNEVTGGPVAKRAPASPGLQDAQIPSSAPAANAPTGIARTTVPQRTRDVMLASIGGAVGSEGVIADQAYVHAGAFADLVNALKLKARLSGVGVVDVLPLVTNGKTLHRVRVGPFSNLPAAERALKAAIALGVADAHVVVIQ